MKSNQLKNKIVIESFLRALKKGQYPKLIITGISGSGKSPLLSTIYVQTTTPHENFVYRDNEMSDESKSFRLSSLPLLLVYGGVVVMLGNVTQSCLSVSFRRLFKKRGGKIIFLLKFEDAVLLMDLVRNTNKA